MSFVPPSFARLALYKACFGHRAISRGKWPTTPINGPLAAEELLSALVKDEKVTRAGEING